MITIVGIPFGVQTLKMAALAYGRLAGIRMSIQELRLSSIVLMNVLWLIAVEYGLRLRMPFSDWHFVYHNRNSFGLQHFKLTAIALNPFGRDIVKI